MGEIKIIEKDIQALIPIENGKMEGVKTVDARKLHEFLESKQQFSNWITNRIKKFGFIEGVDFVKLNKFIYSDSKPTIEYHLSTEMGKEVSMVENNEKGSQARRYFIACEKQLKNLPIETEIDLLVRSAKLIQQQQKQINEHTGQIKQLEGRLEQNSGFIGFMTVRGMANIRNVKLRLREAITIGKKATKICREVNLETKKVTDQMYGEVNTYPVEVLEEVFDDAFPE
ncbi:antA/AntB antirepressor family protein [bacterium]|nr:antA/AntB antirepressor family protein [bacterium]